MPSIFDFAKSALEKAGVKVGESWEETKSQTLRQARAQLARRDIRPETAARWNQRAWIVMADADKDTRIDPRVTAVRR